MKNLWKDNGFTPLFLHLKSPQDESKPFSKLTPASKYNIMCDEMSGKAIHKEPSQSLPCIGINLMINIKGQWITDNIGQRTTEASKSTEKKLI